MAKKSTTKKQETAKEAKTGQKPAKTQKTAKKATKEVKKPVLQVWHRPDGVKFIAPKGTDPAAPNLRHVADIVRYTELDEKEADREKRARKLGHIAPGGLVGLSDGRVVKILKLEYISY